MPLLVILIPGVLYLVLGCTHTNMSVDLGFKPKTYRISKACEEKDKLARIGRSFNCRAKKGGNQNSS